jgi:hypothetical protein
VKETDNYLHKTLPINIETQIFNACNIIADKPSKPKLTTYTSSLINNLIKAKDDTLLKFNKKEINMPDIKSL